ncbi:hypothetical protein GQ600_25539 [Phytophthora cactorum]|nr:hypothetical protein GQ600_25539 [Phytophthora cactorum]
MKELLYPIPRHGNRVVDFTDSSLDIPKTIKLKSSIVPEPPSAQLLPGKEHGEKLMSKKWWRVWEITMRGFSTTFAATVHLQVRPWAAIRPYCFLISLDCHHLNISGQREEVDTKWREFDGSTVVMMVIKHCPLVDIPDTFNEFHSLSVLKFTTRQL